MGGKNAAVILADADLDYAALGIAWGRCINAGQSCIAAKRFIIEEPAFPFNEGAVKERVTYWPDAFVKRIA